MVRQFQAEVAARVRTARAKAGWTQERLAERIGVEPATLSRYEVGRLPLPLEILWRISQALGTKLSALVDVQARLPTELTAPTGDKGPPRREATALLAAWGQLRPRDRKVVLSVCRELKKR